MWVSSVKWASLDLQEFERLVSRVCGLQAYGGGLNHAPRTNARTHACILQEWVDVWISRLHGWMEGLLDGRMASTDGWMDGGRE